VKVKRSLFVLASLALAAGCADSTPPPVAPAPPPPPVASAPPPSAAPPSDHAATTEGDVTVAYARGMQIVVKRTPGAEFVAARLCIRGGVRDWTAENAGIEDIALSVATSGGTQSLAKGPFSQKLASLGATIHGNAGNDFSGMNAKAPKASWDDLFPLFVETFLAPALPASEFDVVKQRALSSLRHEMEDGDGRLWLLARKAVFAGHPYANRATGSVETVSAMKLEDLATQLAKLRDTNRLVLVVVGDVDPSHIVDQAKSAFASVPRGSYVDTPMPQLHFTASHLSGDPFKLPTNYVESMFAGPSWNDPDFTSLWLGMVVLGERVFDEVRTKRNLSYAPSAYLDVGRAAPFGALYVTAVDPGAAMKVMFDEAHRLATELVPAKELDASKSVFLSSHLQAHEAVDGQAYDLADAVVLGGDWHLAKTNIERLRATTPEAVRDAARKWFTNVQTAIVGDPAKLDPKVVAAQ
jgi:zinc protease